MSAEDVFQSSWLVGALVLVVTSVWLTLWAARRLGRRARRRRAARAQRAERGAAALLEARGFEVLGRQVRKSWAVISEGGEVRFDLVADYLVKMRGQRWVAEVKTGERALDLRHGPTRRQLLEYREAFAVEGVLLVDAEGQTLRRVHFPRAGTGRRSTAMATFIAGLATGLALAAYWFSSV
jgi:hypothetical protein